METGLIGVYNGEWILPYDVTVGIIDDYKKDYSIVDRIIEITTLERGAGAHIGYGLEGFISKEEIKNEFNSLCNSVDSDHGDYFTFASTIEGASYTGGNCYMLGDICCIAYFHFNQEKKISELKYEWYIKNKRTWKKFVLYENIPLRMLQRFIIGDIEAKEILLDDLTEEYEETEPENTEIFVIKAEPWMLDLPNLQKMFEGLYQYEIAPYLGINENLSSSLRSRLSNRTYIHWPKITLRSGGKISFVGIPKNMNSKYPTSDLNTIVITNPQNEMVVAMFKMRELEKLIEE